ncbi:Homeobox-leucine zipper protein HAT5 [Linum grandiflorum]
MSAMANDLGGGGGTCVTNLPPPALLRNSKRSHQSASQPLESFFLPGSSPSFLGPRSIVRFDDASQVNGSSSSSKPFFCSFELDENGDDDLDEYFRQPEKKRRLSVDQVQFLEKSFEVDNKLEPDRKVQLAKDLGLQPRQVAIWFQNRRARWKTKQLEKDYDTLQSSFDSLQADYAGLLKEKDQLKSEIDLLTEKLQQKERAKAFAVMSEKDDHAKTCQGQMEKAAEACKQEDISSARSGIFDSESPHYTDGVHSSLLEAGDSSYVFEPDQSSDLSSQDEEDNLSRNLLPAAASYVLFPKLEDEDDYSDPSASFEDNAFWSSWPY